MSRLRHVLLAAVVAATVARAQAADIRVLTAGAYRPVLEAVVPPFESRSGNHVIIVTDTASGVAARVARGDPFDIAILTAATAAAPERDAKIIVVTPIASVGLAVAVKAGAAKPDVSTPAALKAALLAAPSVAILDPASGAISGEYVASMFEQMGIAAQMKSKLVLAHDDSPAQLVDTGHASMAISEASELVGVAGIAIAGPLPGNLQHRTVYVAGMSPKAAEAPLILLAVLAAPQTAPVLEQKGMGPP